MTEPATYDRLPPVLSAGAMREADRRTIEELGLAGLVLMETAGRAVAEEARRMLAGIANPCVFVACGKGNNAGDGLVVARYLVLWGIRVDVLLAVGPVAAGDARTHFELLQRAGELEPDAKLQFVDALSSDKALPDLIVDALLGTGLDSDVRSPLDGLIDAINEAGRPVLSIDLPSGLNADSGRIMGRAIRAGKTVTMGALKAGLVLEDGPDLAGTVTTADIGIPPTVLQDFTAEPGCAVRSTDDILRGRFQGRTRSDNKYTSGPLIVVGGSAGFVGAPVLAARGAARAGSGYVSVYCPDEAREDVQRHLTEIPVTAWASDDPDQDLGGRWSKAKAMCIGPGLGRTKETLTRVPDLLEAFDGPVVVDADALHALKDAREWVSRLSGGRWVFTPHRGEYARMEKNPGNPINDIEAARTFAREWNVVLLLKGQPSIIAAPDGRVVVNATGHAAAGTAGSGDVLGGMVAGLLAKGIPPFDAAVCAIHLGGRAVERFLETGASQTMMAGDILDALPEILARYTDT